MAEVATPEMVDEVHLSSMHAILVNASHGTELNSTASQVRDALDVESARGADETGSSVGRNQFNISPSTFHKIVKNRLCLHPFRSFGSSLGDWT